MIRTLMFILMFVLSVSAQDSVPVFPENGFIQGWQKQGHLKRYTGKNLYGHINGGAELFLEYGFRELHVQSYIKSGQELAVECYIMSDPVAAAGIYLQRTGEEAPLAGVPARNSGSRYQITARCGNWFIQVFNYSGADDNVTVMVSFLNAVLNHCEDKGPDEGDRIMDLLPKGNRVEGTEGIFRGDFALQPVYTFGTGDLFLLQGNGTGVYADYRDTDGHRYTQLVLDYRESGMATAAFRHVRQNLDPYLMVLLDDEQYLVFKDFNDLFGDMVVSDGTIRIRINLSNRPE